MPSPLDSCRLTNWSWINNRDVHVSQALQPRRPHIESSFSIRLVNMDCARLRAILISSFKEEARDHKLLQAVFRSWTARDPVQIVSACPIRGASQSFSPLVLERSSLYMYVYMHIYYTHLKHLNRSLMPITLPPQGFCCIWECCMIDQSNHHDLKSLWYAIQRKSIRVGTSPWAFS